MMKTALGVRAMASRRCAGDDKGRAATPFPKKDKVTALKSASQVPF